MSEPMFTVPLSALADVSLSKHDKWKWFCLMERDGRAGGCSFTFGFDSESEARTSAIKHLAGAHGIRPAGEVEWGVRHSSLHFDPPQEFVDGPDGRSAAEEFLRDCRSDPMTRGAHLVQRSVSEWEEVPSE